MKLKLERWKTKEELAKAKAGLSVYHDVPVDDIQIKQESAQQSWGNQRKKISSTRDQKHQHTKTYSEDQAITEYMRQI